MTTVAVVQARTGSTRLSGKVLEALGGRPLLSFMLARLSRATCLDEIVVATTVEGRDDPVAELAAAAGVRVVRGSEHDVLSRFGLVLDEYRPAVVVRVTADCPLADPALVDCVVNAHTRHGASYTSNTLVRTFPDGLDVEVVDARALGAAVQEATDPVEREHVTPFVYRRPERFALRAVRGSALLGHLRWTVDTREDLDVVRAIVDTIGSDDFSWEDALAVAPPPTPPGTLRPATHADASLGWATDDPGARVWMVEGDPPTALRVVVVDGTGSLEMRGGELHGRATQVLSDLTRLLGADYQVRRLVCDPTMADAAEWAAAGFEVHDDQVEWVHR
jgi:spore coat polysaccharide biosynthesis protein SpsF